MTKTTRRKAVMSLRGLQSTEMMSASMPGARVPFLSCIWIDSAARDVAFIARIYAFHMETSPELIPLRFLPARVDVERRSDGTLILLSPEPLRPFARCIGEYLERWAAEKPKDVFLAERE